MSNEVVEQTRILLNVGTNEMEILEFFIEDQDAPVYFGMNVAKVMQVIESPRLEPGQHGRHPSFLGAVPLREHILPIIDLSVWLKMKRRKQANEVVIVTEFSKAVTGFLVSGVTEIHRVGWDEVNPPGTFLQDVMDASVVGTIQSGDRLIQLLDMESVLADLDPATLGGVEGPLVRASRPYPVLIADDSATIRAMLEKSLTAANFAVTSVSNGQEAWGRALALKSQAEREGRNVHELLRLVVSDIEMPSMDGFTLTKNLKADPVLNAVPVVLYSSIITKELRHKGESVGADDQVSKPELGSMAERALRLIEG